MQDIEHFLLLLVELHITKGQGSGCRGGFPQGGGQAVSGPLHKNIFKALLVLASKLLGLQDKAVWDIKADKLNHKKMRRTLAFSSSESRECTGNPSVRSPLNHTYQPFRDSKDIENVE